MTIWAQRCWIFQCLLICLVIGVLCTVVPASLQNHENYHCLWDGPLAVQPCWACNQVIHFIASFLNLSFIRSMRQRMASYPISLCLQKLLFHCVNLSWNICYRCSRTPPKCDLYFIRVQWTRLCSYLLRNKLSFTQITLSHMLLGF